MLTMQHHNTVVNAMFSIDDAILVKKISICWKAIINQKLMQNFET